MQPRALEKTAAYDAKAKELAKKFRDNDAKFDMRSRPPAGHAADEDCLRIRRADAPGQPRGMILSQPLPERHRMRKEDRTFWADFKRFFLRGLAILLPSVLTIWIVVQLYLFVDKQVASPINAGIRAGVVWVMPRLPDRYQPRWFKVTERELAEFRATLHQQGTSESRALLRRNDTDLRNEIRRQEFARFWESQWYLRFLGLIVAIVLFYLAGVIFGGLFGRALYQQLERFITRIPVIKQVYLHVNRSSI